MLRFIFALQGVQLLLIHVDHSVVHRIAYGNGPYSPHCLHELQGIDRISHHVVGIFLYAMLDKDGIYVILCTHINVRKNGCLAWSTKAFSCDLGEQMIR